jgi:hypothetical protein
MQSPNYLLGVLMQLIKGGQKYCELMIEADSAEFSTFPTEISLKKIMTITEKKDATKNIKANCLYLEKYIFAPLAFV